MLPTISDFTGFVRKHRQALADLADVAAKHTEALGLLENIPFLSVAVKAYGIVDGWAQYKLRRNAKEFLITVENGDATAIADALDALKDDPRYAAVIEESVFSILIESSSSERVRLLGRLMIGLASGKINNDEFVILTEIVQSAPMPSLKSLPTFFLWNEFKAGKNYSGRIPMEPLLLPLGVVDRNGTAFNITPLGCKLYEVCFDGVVKIL